MTDCELLEMAAKAGGYGLSAVSDMIWSDAAAEYIPWNPLTDDGDALRLAVKTGEPFVVRSRCVTTMGGLMENFDPAVSGDDLRATRRAIVLAAAEIGKQIKGGQHGTE